MKLDITRQNRLLLRLAVAVLLSALLFSACGRSGGNEVQKGDPSHHGGTATVRKAFTPKPDDPTTNNDESNDQPLGHFGRFTFIVFNFSSGHEYTLDADVEGGEVQRLYFPKGGWVDFISSDIDNEGTGTGTDEEGRQWEFRGLADGSSMSDDEENDSPDDDDESELE